LKAGRILVKINRISAWMLLIFMIIFIVSGYAWYNRAFLSLQEARYLHTELDLYMLFFFLVHSLISIRLALGRWRIGLGHRWLVNLLLVTAGIISFGLALIVRGSI
jgi:hypothetical protein